MSDIVIRVEQIGKEYLINHKGRRPSYSSVRDVVAKGIGNLGRKILGRADAVDTVENFWALRDVSFDVKRGEVVGIIGRNGAGKSTLLKVLSRITEPTTGKITIDGRVASLLEVGTGFHPELTGRENVFLNGSILGMSHAEVRRKFDEIVAFAEVEKFLDTPVKRYSSGMYMRLAFAVAAHLDTEILVVDEVLAVGDSTFQKKVLGKMGDVASGGRTVLFVSHNMGTLLAICKTGILLEAGRLAEHGDIRDVAKSYFAGRSQGSEGLDQKMFRGPLKSIQFESIELNGHPVGKGIPASPTDELVFRVNARATESIPDFKMTFSLFYQGTRLLSMHDVYGATPLAPGPFSSTFRVPERFLRPGEYSIAVGGLRMVHNDWIWGTDLALVQMSSEWGEGYDPSDEGLVNLKSGGSRSQGTS